MWREFEVCFIAILIIFISKENTVIGAYENTIDNLMGQEIEQEIDQEEWLTPMEALDKVKERYAANFIKSSSNTKDDYYYKLPFADYYLVYEGKGATEKDYLFHLYEFVEDEPDTGIGHTVTYGWYTVNNQTGVIINQTSD